MPSLASFVQNPHRYLYWAHKISPVLWVNLFDVKGWLVTGFAEAEAVLKDPRFIKEMLTLLPSETFENIPDTVLPAYRTVQHMMLFMDPPGHTRLRRLATKAFTPGLIARLRDNVEAVCHSLLDRRVIETEHDLIADFAYPLPLWAITTLLGVPEEDHHRLRVWTEYLVRVIDLNSSVDDWIEAGPPVIEATEYLLRLFDVKRAHPEPDLITGLLAAQEQDDRLSDQEIVSTCLLLLIAGHETSANLISSGFYRLLTHPKQYAWLAQDLSRVPTAVEEMLRYDPPGFLTSRWAAEDLTFAGKTVKRGHMMMIAIGAANRDPRVLDKPRAFDAARAPNKHLSFSSGIHFCLGAALGRMETEVALKVLLARVKDPVLLEEPRWRASIAIRGLTGLKLRARILARA